MPNILTGKGRIGRLKYFGVSIGLYAVLIFFARLLPSEPAPMPQNEPATSTGAIIIFILAVLAMSWVSIANSVRRLHDLGHTGWLAAVALIPFVGWAFGLYLLFAPGDAGRNKYGVRGFDSFEQSIAEQQRLADRYGDSPAVKRSEAEDKYLHADGTFNNDGIFDYTTK